MRNRPPPEPAANAPEDPGAKAAKVFDSHLRDRNLREALARLLRRRGVPESRVEDVIQEAFLSVSRASGLPSDPEEQRRYIFAAAFRKGVSQHRKAKVLAKGDAIGVEYVAEAVDVDPIAGRDVLEKVVRGLPGGQLVTFQWLARHLLLGDTFTEIGAEASVDEDVVRKRVKTLQQRVTRTIQAIAVLALVVGAWYLRRSNQIAHEEPKTVPTSAPATSTPVPVSSAAPEEDLKERVRQLRRDAFRACLANDWETCSDRIEEAIRIDPDVLKDPEVKAALKDATDGTDPRWSKTGGWKAPKVRGYRLDDAP